MLLFLIAAAFGAEGPLDPAAEFFKPKGTIPTFQITVDPENLALLAKEPRKAVKCTIKVNGRTYTQVGIHLKGQAGSYRDWNDKPALTLNMDKFKKKQLFEGMDKFHLNNSVQDNSFMNEIITAEMCRAVGVPAAPGNHATVELNGRKVGMYLLKEGYDREFLKLYFKDTSGNLYDGGFLTDVDQELELKQGKDVQRKDLAALAAAARTENNQERLALLDKKVDLDRLYSLWAVEVLCGDWDGYSRNRNNYKVYFDPLSKKAVFFAHGKDQMFQNPEDGLIHEWGGLICRRLFQTDEGKKRYISTLKTIFEKQFNLAEINKRVDAHAVRIKDAVNAIAPGQGDEWLKGIEGYKQTLKTRHDYIKAALKNVN